jgi:hypothetical protein
MLFWYYCKGSKELFQQLLLSTEKYQKSAEKYYVMDVMFIIFNYQNPFEKHEDPNLISPLIFCTDLCTTVFTKAFK